MTRIFRKRFGTSDWLYVLVSIALLAFYVYFVVSFLFFTPYPGVTFTSTSKGWQINDSMQPDLSINDVLVQVGNLSFEEYQADRKTVPFAGYGPGDTVPDIITADGRVTEIQMPAPSLNWTLTRLLSTLWFFPFWAAGTIVLLFLQPRDTRWRLLVAFMYLTAIWILAGALSAWRIGSSRIILGAAAWLMVPVFVHLHLTVPNPTFRRLGRISLPAIYISAFILSFLELFQAVPSNAPPTGLLLATLVSVGLILHRIIKKVAQPSEKIAARLMLFGILLAFGPGIAAVILPQVVGSSAASTLALFISTIAIPILPFFYIYAIYKHQLGALEFRASRALTLYSFILIYPTVFIIVLLFAEQWISTPQARTIYLLFASIVFILAAPPLQGRFQKIVSRMAYGTEHDPDDILRVFAKRIPSALERDTLVDLLTREIMPTLLIRQSALFTFDGEKIAEFYSDNLDQEEPPVKFQELQGMLTRSERYRSPVEAEKGYLPWVHLPIAVRTRDKVMGIWLLGRRDPDDFYPRDDIELLEALANQIAPVIENIRLYAALKQQAGRLADQVAERTVELSAERDRTQAILDSAGEGIFFTDPVGQILYINPAMAELSGYQADELIGKSLAIWKYEDESSLNEDLWKAVYSGQEWGGELTLRRKDGSSRDVSITIAPIHSDPDKLTGFVGVQSDITKLKEVDRLKSSIISSVSHELKTPLTTIKTYLMLLQRGKPEKRETYLGVLEREADRLTHIIEDLLDLSALDTGKIASKLEPTSSSDLARRVFESSQALAGSKHVSLRLRLQRNLPAVIADAGQVEQVLSNLIVNACNYTQTGGNVTLKATLDRLQGDLAVCFSISDTGPGISPDEMPHLFDRFFRGQAARDSNAPGTGLGLTICRDIIDIHGGEISVKSQLGEGATFMVRIPAMSALSSQSRVTDLAIESLAGD
jgi:two-component system phosphate regulon sensor histidine kinase PhoR